MALFTRDKKKEEEPGFRKSTAMYLHDLCWMLSVVLVLFLVCGGKNCFGKKGTFTPFRAALFFAVGTYCLLGFFHDSLIYHAPMFWFLFGMSWRELSQKKTSESA